MCSITCFLFLEDVLGVKQCFIMVLQAQQQRILWASLWVVVPSLAATCGTWQAKSLEPDLNFSWEVLDFEWTHQHIGILVSIYPMFFNTFFEAQGHRIHPLSNAFSAHPRWVDRWGRLRSKECWALSRSAPRCWPRSCHPRQPCNLQANSKTYETRGPEGSWTFKVTLGWSLKCDL